MKTIKVALIEDDAAIVQMYTTRFALEPDFVVKTAGDGARGLKLIQSMAPDVILLDMMMPHMSGLETLSRIRKLPHGTTYKVIALTNMKDPDITSKIRQLGISDYLVKAEHSPSAIVAKIRSILG